ncbi:Acg family FMN-binding oxidoreductase [Ramlibacter rhizophilus]|uniref:Twin-arginine translocation pathway signal protein n=1 Tax=Ramlibacter rhizophilus TaxID=1781167 RepID=A0A4Z0BFT0_9BURK|nr:twin-arginine translocation pathway signal protein [Ramlibacter rhizophilus]TFY97239.1 twin-arginine translocation pathway signal protein [Ramlibacter rhizophilus]
MDRRSFIRLVGGGTVAAAIAPLSGCSLTSAYPPEALEAWRGPGAEPDVRRWAVAHAITAPNPHNLQPWLVDLREPGVITLMTDRERVLPHTDPFGRQILIGHGAFIELLVIALAERGHGADVVLWPQGELGANLRDWDRRPVARIVLRPQGERDPLFAQLLQRHTPKSDFDTTRPVAASTLQALLASVPPSLPAIRGGGTVDVAALDPLRRLCWESAQVELLTPRTVMESIHLTRVGPKEILAHRDGITLNSLMIRGVDALGMFDRENPPAEGSQAYKNMMARFEGHSRTAMGFVWLAGRNGRHEQVQAGRAYVRLQLKATELGVGVHPMSQALQEFQEMAPHYAQAHRLMLNRPAPASPEDETLQMFCRLGYTASPAPATPRRVFKAFVVA